VFVGAIPPELRSIVAEHIRDWRPDDLWIGCSGNFTIERTAHDAAAGAALHSNDVSIYSVAVGQWMSGQQVDVTVSPASMDRLDWLAPYFDGGSGSVAALMLATRFLDAVDRAGHPYFDRLLAGYRDQFPAMHAQTVERIEKAAVPLASFHAADVRAWLRDTVPADATVMSFPPFYKGGYSRLFKALDEHLTWAEPTFEEMGDDELAALIDAYTDRPRWMLGLPRPYEALEPHRRGVVQTSVRNLPIHVYSTSGRPRVSRPRQLTSPVLAPRLDGHDVGDLALAQLTARQFAALRAQYLSRKIAPGGAALAIGVLSGGRLVGCFAVNRPTFDPTAAYMLSDFAVAPTRYRNLAKLVLVAALSTEARLMIERSMSRRLRRIATTAFTDRPVSMKYRSLLQLDSRKDATDGVHRYMLNYSADLGRWPLAEGLEVWRARWGQTR
jgi:hypothetical protein